jgi:transcriptional regulator with XRE-family HTH domain
MSSEDFGTHARFGPRLQRLRELRNLTQAELGRRAGMAAASVSHFETGQRMPSLESLVKLANALEVSADALLGRAELTADSGAQVDPIFLQASRASAETLDTVKRVTAAILSAVESRHK